MNYLDDLEKLVKAHGFENADEFHRLVASVDLSTKEKLFNFNVWREYDGSKAGLLKILPEEAK